MKKIITMIFASFLLNGSLMALLPPLYQDIAEIKSILEDKKLGQLLQAGEVIEQIRKKEDGYLIVTNHHQLFVRVIYTPSQRIGPAQFQLEFNDPISN